jgi:hypothetical protein
MSKRTAIIKREASPIRHPYYPQSSKTIKSNTVIKSEPELTKPVKVSAAELVSTARKNNFSEFDFLLPKAQNPPKPDIKTARKEAKLPVVSMKKIETNYQSVKTKMSKYNIKDEKPSLPSHTVKPLDQEDLEIHEQLIKEFDKIYMNRDQNRSYEEKEPDFSLPPYFSGVQNFQYGQDNQVEALPNLLNLINPAPSQQILQNLSDEFNLENLGKAEYHENSVEDLSHVDTLPKIPTHQSIKKIQTQSVWERNQEFLQRKQEKIKQIEKQNKASFKPMINKKSAIIDRNRHLQMNQNNSSALTEAKKQKPTSPAKVQLDDPMNNFNDPCELPSPQSPKQPEDSKEEISCHLDDSKEPLEVLDFGEDQFAKYRDFKEDPQPLPEFTVLKDLEVYERLKIPKVRKSNGKLFDFLDESGSSSEENPYGVTYEDYDE